MTERDEPEPAVQLNPETGWPIELDPRTGAEGVPFGRYRRCPHCRGAGSTRDGQCSACKGVPYVDGFQPDHWCTACLGKPQYAQANTTVARVFCPGPPSDRDELNAEVSGLARTLGQELEDIAGSIVDDSDDPVEIMELHEQLYALTRLLHQRAMADPRLPPAIWMKYKDRHYPESPKRPPETYPVPEFKPGKPPGQRGHTKGETNA